jgi:periplasmic mercuric ion binding protein
MKKNIFTIAALSILLSASAWGQGAKVKVDGMVCAFCAQGIKKKFAENPAIESTEVDLDKKEVVLAFRPDQKMSDDEIRKAIVAAGYKVNLLERVK